MGLIETVMKEAGVDQDQAKGGLGAIVKLLREQLDTKDFGEVAKAIPNASELADKAPEAGGLAGVLGGLGKALGGEAADVGNLAQLAGVFRKLGLDAEMVTKFVNAIISFLQRENAGKVVGLIKKVLA